MSTSPHPTTEHRGAIPPSSEQHPARHPELSATVVECPLGPLTVIASDTGVRAILWPDHVLDPDSATGPGASEADVGVASGADHPVLRAAETELAEYFAGRRRHFDVPIDPVGTEFQRAAWEALRSIPYGATASYAEQAERLGDRRKARAVGAANSRNPIPIIVPCHRVVGASGALTGFAGGLETKSWLLDHERRHGEDGPQS